MSPHRRIAVTMLVDIVVWGLALWMVAGCPPPPPHVRARQHQLAARACRRLATWAGRQAINQEAAYYQTIRP